MSPPPRIIKSHCAFVPQYPRVVYLVRDGRDVAVSFYHYARKRKAYLGTLREFVKNNFEWWPSWSEHVSSWLFDPHDVPLVLVRYEDLLTNTVDEMDRLCAFAGISASRDDIKQAVHWSRFDRLKRLEERRGLGYVADGMRNCRFIRKGKRGGWQSEFDAATKRVFKEQHQRSLQRLGYASDADW